MLVGFTLLCANLVSAATIDFTRFLHHEEVATELPIEFETSFKAQVGQGRLVLRSLQNLDAIRLKLNGAEIDLSLAKPTGTQRSDARAPEFQLPVELREQNTISLSSANDALERNTAADVITTLSGETTLKPVSVRIRQSADVELNVISRVHFNTNVSDFLAAREFYGKLGFSTLTGFPDTNTQAMARAIGITTPTSYDGSAGGEAGGYKLHGELIGLGFMSGSIDLIEFSIPRDESPPYSALNHLGMARAAFFTRDIEADYAYMKSIGVVMLSGPTAWSDGTRFLIFKDLDGTFYELREQAGQTGDVDDTETTHISGFGPLNINVSDLERSRAWYEMMGHDVGEGRLSSPSLDVADALGFSASVEFESATAVLPGDGSTLELVQWRTPFNPERAYPLPVNHLGIHRTAFATSDIEADVAALKAQGVEFVSPITPCCSGPDSSGRIVAFYDPDGTIVELVEQPAMNWVLPVLLWFRDTFF